MTTKEQTKTSAPIKCDRCYGTGRLKATPLVVDNYGFWQNYIDEHDVQEKCHMCDGKGYNENTRKKK